MTSSEVPMRVWNCKSLDPRAVSFCAFLPDVRKGENGRALRSGIGGMTALRFNYPLGDKAGADQGS